MTEQQTKLYNLISNNGNKYSDGKLIMISYLPKYEPANMYGSYQIITIDKLKNRCYAIEEFTDGMGIVFLDRVYDQKTYKHELCDIQICIDRFKKHYSYHESKIIVYPIDK